MWGQSYARALAADPQDPNIVYLGMDGDPRAGAPAARAAGSSNRPTAVSPGSNWRTSPAAGGCSSAWRWTPRSRGGCSGARAVIVAACTPATTPAKAGGLACKNETWVFNVLVSPRGTVYCPGANLWKSADHGQTWKKISDFKDSLAIVGLEVDPRDEKTMWVSRVAWGARRSAASTRPVDGGASWQEITGDLPYCKPTILRFQPATRELWAGGVGLFKIKQ